MANEGSTKPTYSELLAENLRVRGLLQRMYELVRDGVLVRNTDEDDVFGSFVTQAFRLTATLRETELALAESADIGKLDTADEKAAGTTQAGRLVELMAHPVSSPSVRERLAALPADETVFFRHTAPSFQEEMIHLIETLLAPHSSMAEPSPYKGQVTGSSPVAATTLNTADNGVKSCEYCARYSDRCCHCRNANGMDMKDLLGSAETGGEKAAPENDELHKAAWELSTWAASINWDHRAKNTAEWLDGLRERIEAVQIFGKPETTFPRTSQNQTVASGVEGAHEGTTADKSLALAESSLSSPPPEEIGLKGIPCPHDTFEYALGNTYCADCHQWMHAGPSTVRQSPVPMQSGAESAHSGKENTADKSELLPTQLPKADL